MVFENLAMSGISSEEIIKAILLLAGGIILAVLIKLFIKKIAKKIIYPWVRNNSMGSYKRAVSGGNLVAGVIQWLIIFLFIFQALSIFQIYLLDEILRLSIEFLPKLGVAFLICVIGFLISSIISRSIKDIDLDGSKIIAKIFNIIFITATILAALEAINVKVTSFLYIFVAGLFSISLAIAIAIGIAFGLALKPEITKIVNGFKKKR